MIFSRTLLTASFILANLAPVCVSYAAAPTAIEEYEMLEHCGKRAAELFNKKYGSSGVIYTNSGQGIAEYSNHYNKKLKKCFVLQTYRNIPYKDKTQQSFTMYQLYDINENKKYGDYLKSDGMSMPTSCIVDGKMVCHSEQEWNTLVKPYMEE
jgi:hypothetical protein